MSLAAGAAAGLWLQVSGPAWPAVLLAGVLLAPGIARRAIGIEAIAACLLAGCGIGLQAGESARGGCGRALEPAEPVRVHGFVQAYVPAALDRPLAGQPAGARLTLERAVVWQGGRACRISRLVVRARSGVGQPIEAGTAVQLSGRWRPLGAGGRWPRPNDRSGFISAAHIGRRSADRRAPPVLRLRVAASERLRHYLPTDVVAVARALILAERDELTTEVKHRFATAGLAHLLAISGLHVGILAAGLTLLAGTLSRRRRHAIAAVGVWVYVFGIGMPASAVRAAILFAAYAAARGRGRPLSLFDAVGAAAIVLLMRNPVDISGPGFQLSFAGFLGLIGGAAFGNRFTGSRAGRWWLQRFQRSVQLLGHRVPLRGQLERGIVGLAAGTGAFLATAPIVAAHFEQVTPVSVVGHLLATPLVAMTLWSLAGVVFLPWPLAGPFAGSGTLALRLLDSLATELSSFGPGHAAVGPPGPATWMTCAALLYAAHRFLAGGRLITVVLPVASAVAIGLVAPATVRARLDGRTLVCTLDVGQGDAAVVRTAKGNWMVFDAGPAFGARNAGRDIVLPFIRARGGSEVALFVLSHPDLDHVGGATGLFAALPVRRVLDAGAVHPRAAYLDFLELSTEVGARWLRARRDAVLRLDEVTLTVLNPPEPPSRKDMTGLRDAANASSVSFRLDVGGSFAYVNTGDASVREELEILTSRAGSPLTADLLKVGHHGSRSSTAAEWIVAVGPELAIVSVGAANRYGHPHSDVLGRLREAGVQHTWRTDRDGTLCVVVEQDGSWRWGPPAAPYRTGQIGRKYAPSTGE